MAGTAAGAAKAREARTAGLPEAQPVIDAKAAADRRLAARYGRVETPALPGLEPVYVVTRRPLLMGDVELQVGDVVDITDWPRPEAWVRAGRIKATFPNAVPV